MEYRVPGQPGGFAGGNGPDPFTRVPPQNLEAEQNVLGAMLLSADAVNRVLEILKVSEVFYRKSHQVVYDAIRALAERNEPVDLVTVSNYLEANGRMEEVGGRLHLADLYNAVATPANAEYYGRIVLDKALRRALIRVGANITELGYQDDEDVETLIDKAEQVVFDLGQRRTSEDYTHVEPVLVQVFEKAEQQAQQQGVVVGTPTGFYDLDKLLAGMQPGNLVIMGARPSMGKTSLAMSIARNAAAGSPETAGRPVIMFSLEMSREELVTRLLCSEARVNMLRLKQGFLTEEDWPKLLQGIGRLQDFPVYIDDTAAITVMEVRSKCRKLMTQLDEPLGLVLIDYLQLMDSPQTSRYSSSENRATEVAKISRSLKALARELECPVMALSQLARAAEQTKDKKPMLSHLRESGSIEQDADIVMFIHRDDYYNEMSEYKNQAEIIVAKNRNGPTGSAMLYFHKEFTLFDNLYQPGATS
ncbi:MAG: replicative DNA helicase [Candidatus Sericytochromatia bacterium]|nr:replicative DNA helicase [Candidatus Tanganyikabacteria bacterium]